MPENTPLEEYNNIHTFSYGYNKLRFIKPRIYWGYYLHCTNTIE